MVDYFPKLKQNYLSLWQIATLYCGYVLPLLVLGFAGGIAGVYGDLFESALKRDAGIKDSSSILLGHGGILDRFDSAVVVAPVALVVLYLFGITA